MGGWKQHYHRKTNEKGVEMDLGLLIGAGGIVLVGILGVILIWLTMRD